MTFLYHWFLSMDPVDHAFMLWALCGGVAVLGRLALDLVAWRAERTQDARKPAAPKRELPDHVMEAMQEYLDARLDANGNQPLPLVQVMTEFARWHGPHNLERGILRPEPPPIPETTLVTTQRGEC